MQIQNDINFTRERMKYWHKKVLVALGVLTLGSFHVRSNEDVQLCSVQDLESLCSQDSYSDTVCAVDTEKNYLNYDSPCKACSNGQVTGFIYGECPCPQVPCSDGQACINEECIDPKQANVQQLVDASNAHLKRGAPDMSLKLAQIAIEKRKDFSYSYYLASLAAFQLEKPKDTLKFIKQAIKLDSEVPGYYLIRGRAFKEINKHEDAELQYNKVRELGFEDEGLLCFYEAQNLLDAKRNEEAIQKFNIAVDAHPEKADWFVRKAMALAINKEYKMSLVTCRDGLKIHPRNKDILNFMKQFHDIDDGEEDKIEAAQDASVKPGEGKKGPDPKEIERVMQERKEEQEFKWEQKRIEEKKKRDEAERQAKEQSVSSEL